MALALGKRHGLFLLIPRCLPCISKACQLQPAAAAPPGPKVSRRPSRLLPWQRTAITPRQRRIEKTARSVLPPPHRPRVGPATSNRLFAMAVTRRWIHSDILPKLPSTTPQTSPILIWLDPLALPLLLGPPAASYWR